MKISAQEFADAIVSAYERGYKDAATAVKPAQPNTTTWPEIRIGDVPPYHGIISNTINAANVSAHDKAETIVGAVREQLLKRREDEMGVQ